MFKFLFSKRDEGINCNRKIFGISITTKPNRLKLKQLDEKIEKLKKENTILNNLVSSCSYQNLTKECISNLDSTKPFVSVIITVYNLGRRYLVQCLESIINQSLKNIEIILVNDCSPLEEDDKVCDEYANKDKRIKYIKHDSNMGDGKARMTGLKNASGYSISFIDGDDFLSLNLYEIAFYEMVKNNVEIVCYNYNIVNITENNISVNNSYMKYIPYSVFYGDNIIKLYASIDNPLDMGLWSKLYKKELLDKLGYDNILDRKRAKDVSYNFKIFSNAKSFLYIPLNLYFYVVSKSDSITNSRLKKDTYFTDVKDSILDANKYIDDNKLYNNKIYLNSLFSHFLLDFYEHAIYLNRIDKNKDYLLLIKNIIVELLNEKAIDKNVLLNCLSVLTDKKDLISWYKKIIL